HAAGMPARAEAWADGAFPSPRTPSDPRGASTRPLPTRGNSIRRAGRPGRYASCSPLGVEDIVMRRIVAVSVAVLCSVALLLFRAGVGGPVGTSDAAPTAGAGPLDDIIQRRGLTPDEAEAALKTFVPPGKYDDFVMVTSGGHRGSVLLYGIPSMRLLKEVPVYAPDSWQGWAQGNIDSDEVLKKGSFAEGLPTQTWGDLHH